MLSRVMVLGVILFSALTFFQCDETKQKEAESSLTIVDSVVISIEKASPELLYINNIDTNVYSESMQANIVNKKKIPIYLPIALSFLYGATVEEYRYLEDTVWSFSIINAGFSSMLKLEAAQDTTLVFSFGYEQLSQLDSMLLHFPYALSDTGYFKRNRFEVSHLYNIYGENERKLELVKAKSIIARKSQ